MTKRGNFKMQMEGRLFLIVWKTTWEMESLQLMPLNSKRKVLGLRSKLNVWSMQNNAKLLNYSRMLKWKKQNQSPKKSRRAKAKRLTNQENLNLKIAQEAAIYSEFIILTIVINSVYNQNWWVLSPILSLRWVFMLNWYSAFPPSFTCSGASMFPPPHSTPTGL